ncbi:MAG: UDP-N-acetylmuramoyl-tripeptide--D-alanyl-D-alanine ligase [Spirochaetaceae bacterium]
MTDKAAGSPAAGVLTAKRASETQGITLEKSFAGSSSHNAELELRGAEVDSRKVAGGELFVALKGERTDGHRFLTEAVKRGALAVLVSKSFADSEEGKSVLDETGVPVLTAANTLEALQSLGKKWVSGITGLKRIGITGSNGKTTTKELIASALSRAGNTVKNTGNLNSEIGLPLAVLSARLGHEYGVFEMGINHPGEMDVLADVLKPEYMVITNIGTAHIGYMGSREAIAREKSKALSALSSQGRGFIPEDSEWEEYMRSVSQAPLEKYGETSTPGIEEIEDLGFEGWRIRYEGRDIFFSLMGRYNLGNALAAVSVGRYFGLKAGQIAEGIETAVVPEGRSSIHTGRVTIFEDSYNANIDSMRAVIGEASRQVPPGRLILVLGSMKELGEKAEETHKELGRICARSGAKAVLLLGEETRWTKEELKGQGFEGVLIQSSRYEEIEGELLRCLETGDTILLKGSRTMELERFVEPLERKSEAMSIEG